MTLGSGQSVTAEIGQPHAFDNDRDEWTTFTVETRPPGGVVTEFQMAYGGERGRRGEGWAAAQPDCAGWCLSGGVRVPAGTPLFASATRLPCGTSLSWSMPWAPALRPSL